MKRRLMAVLASFLFVFGMMLSAGQEALAAEEVVYEEVYYEEIGYCEIVAITADGPGSQEFIVTNYGAEDDFNWEATSGQKGSLHLGTGASTRLSIPTNDYITVYVDSATGKNDGSFTTSANEYPIEVYASYGQVTELLAEGYLSMAQGNFGYTVDQNITVDGKLYTCSETTKYLYYGEGGNTLTFNYTEVQQPDKYVDVYFVDERGYMLDSETFSVAPGTITQYEGPDQIEANGKIYNLKEGQNPVIEHDYNSSKTSYSLTFVAEAQAPSKPYSVAINYINSKTQKVVGTDYMSIPVNSSNTFEVPEAIEAEGITYKLSAGSPSKITHNFGDSQREYSISYDVTKERKEYELTVNLVDMASGTIIQTEKEMVPIDGIIFELPSTISDGSADYLLTAGQSTRLTHAYSNPTRTYNIYYNEVGSEEASAYKVDVQYVDVKTNKTLNSKTVNVPAGQGISFTVPSEYNADGTQYVMLSGQQNIVNHAYSSPRRNYMVYYRDINDKENEKTVITQDTITETVTEEGDTVTIPNVVTVIENEESEVEESETTESETAETQEGGGEVTIPDEETPLAPTPRTTRQTGSNTTNRQTEANSKKETNSKKEENRTNKQTEANTSNRQTESTKTTEKTKSTEAARSTEAAKSTEASRSTEAANKPEPAKAQEQEAVKPVEAAKETEAVAEPQPKAEPETMTISDEDVPLAKAPTETQNSSNNMVLPIVLGCAVLLLAAGIIVFFVIRRKKNLAGK